MSAKCSHCERPATCAGVYEAGHEDEDPRPACDVCCGHGCEDGLCFPLVGFEVADLPTDWRPFFAALTAADGVLN